MKVLLLSCKTGGGHDAASFAIKEELELMGHEAFVFDYLTLAGEKVAKRVANAYVKTVQIAPGVFGVAYKIASFISKKTHNSPIYKVNKKMAKYLTAYLEENHYDAIIMTHLFPAETITWMKKQNVNLPMTFGVFTDYTLTPFWEETNCDEYIIPHPDLMDECLERGFLKEKLHPLGIPYSHQILINEETDLYDELGLDKSKKIVLLVGGSMGAGNLGKLTRAFAKCERINQLQIVVVCGNNQKVYNKQLKKYQHHSSFKIIGHTKQLAKYMHIASIVYSKPGGLTSTETAASRTPYIITYPIPGCETANKEFFLHLGMALSGKSPRELVNKGLKLLNDEIAIKTMIDAQAKNIKEDATRNIAQFIIDKITVK